MRGIVEALSVKQQWMKSFLRDAASLLGHDSARVNPDACGGVCGSGLPASLYLSKNRQKQQHASWCGPATVSEALGQMGKSESQSTLADSSNLNTTNDDGTNWGDTESSNPVARVLNKYESINYYEPDAIDSVTTTPIDDYEDDLVVDINGSLAVATSGSSSS
jgi:hypothetical protein